MRDLQEVRLEADELEALRLVDVDGLYNTEAAEGMGVSRQTMDRIVRSARQKVAGALIGGRALRVVTRT